MGSFDLAHAALIFTLWSFVVAGAVSFVLREPDGLSARGCSARELDAAAAWSVCAQCSGDSVHLWVWILCTSVRSSMTCLIGKSCVTLRLIAMMRSATALNAGYECFL